MLISAVQQFFNLFFSIEVELIYRVVLISAVQRFFNLVFLLK